MGSAAMGMTPAEKPAVEPSDEELVALAKTGDSEATRTVLVIIWSERLSWPKAWSIQMCRLG